LEFPEKVKIEGEVTKEKILKQFTDEKNISSDSAKAIGEYED